MFFFWVGVGGVVGQLPICGPNGFVVAYEIGLSLGDT